MLKNDAQIRVRNTLDEYLIYLVIKERYVTAPFIWVEIWKKQTLALYVILLSCVCNLKLYDHDMPFELAFLIVEVHRVLKLWDLLIDCHMVN